MLYTFLLTLLVLDCVVVIGAILLQSGKGGGLAASFGGASSSPDAFIGIRQAGNLLTKVSWWGGATFLVLAFILQMMSSRTNTPRSILERGLGQPVNAAPPPTSAIRRPGRRVRPEQHPCTAAPYAPAPKRSPLDLSDLPSRTQRPVRRSHPASVASTWFISWSGFGDAVPARSTDESASPFAQWSYSSSLARELMPDRSDRTSVAALASPPRRRTRIREVGQPLRVQPIQPRRSVLGTLGTVPGSTSR